MNTTKTLYLFDFDGTITKKDTLFHFLKFATNLNKYYFGFFLFSPLFLFAKLNLLVPAKVKEMFISFFLKGLTKKQLNKISNNYAKQIETICNPKAIELINNLNKNPNIDCYLVSASLDIWLKPIALKYNLNLICTEALFINDIFTGNFKTKNCNFQEKKNRILSEINLAKFNKIISYGDSKGDLAMFSISTESHYKPF